MATRKKALILKEGTVIRIPLADGTFAYGRAIADPYTAFYNYRTTEPSDDIGTIISKPVLFIQTVRMMHPDRWTVLAQQPLEGELTKPVIRFTQTLGNYKKCIIYDSAGMEREATPEECVGLERAAVWDMEHIEQRLLDNLEGRTNPIEENLRVRFSD